MKTRGLNMTEGRTVRSMAHAAAEMLEEQEHLEVRLLRSTGGEYTVQACSRCGRMLRWIGMDQRLTVTLTPAGAEKAFLRISCSGRLSRSVVLVTGMLIVCWPLAVTAAAGAIRSRVLIRRILSLMRCN